MKIQRIITRDGRAVFAALDGRRHFLCRGGPSEGFTATDEEVAVTRILPPVQPPAIFLIGLNYRQHAEEMGREVPRFPVVAMKSPSAALAAGEPILLPRFLPSRAVDFEAELAVVIGRTCKNATRESALGFVAGYTAANDVSARDWQKDHGGGQWCKGKGFDTFCPLGPVLVTPDEIPDPGALAISSRLNGELFQESNTSDLLFPVAELVAFLSGGTTLLPGTVILTGTPSGVGMARNPPRFLAPGDRVVIEIEGIGTLENPVAEEPVS